MFGVITCMKDIEASLPFKIHTVAVDNGNEFLNHQFIRYFQGEDRTDKVMIKRGHKPSDSYLLARLACLKSVKQIIRRERQI